MELRNGTNIPNRLIEIAVAFSIQENVDIAQLVIKNKQAGVMHGQCGWYHPHDKRVTIIMPPAISDIFGMKGRGRYTHLNITVSSRAEFLVMWMAHELRHGWQHQASGRWDLYLNNVALRERDAEHYQYGMLAQWRRMVAAQTQGVA